MRTDRVVGGCVGVCEGEVVEGEWVSRAEPRGIG